MTLECGQRVLVGSQCAFEVAGLAWETGRHSYHRARQVFWNYRDEDRSLYEAPADEWHDVLVRVPKLPDSSLDFERERVLSLAGSPWFLKPVGLVDDPDRLLVLADPHAEPLATAIESAPTSHLLRLGHEVLMMLADLHHVRLVCGQIDADEFVMDREGRWWFLGTDQMAVAESEAESAADLERWATFVGPLCERVDATSPGDGEESVALQHAWLTDRLDRVAQGATDAGDLLADSRKGWNGVRRALRRFRKS